MDKPLEIIYVDSPDKLESLCGYLADQPWMALDTEFLRERTYYPKFCLLQVSAGDLLACVDPLSLPTLDPLFDVIYQDSIAKVFHSARQDLEIFYNLRGSVPGNIFDTQLAAPLLGHAESIGYASLVSGMLGTNLSKSHTRTDWSKRPLSDNQVQYAIDDVLYLGHIYVTMREQLAELDRLSWLAEDFARLSDPSIYVVDPDNSWQRIRAAHRLSGARLSVVQTLAKWREETARRENIPRNWLLKDNVILDLARMQTVTPEELAGLRGIGERTTRKFGKKICALTEESRQRQPHDLANKPPQKQKTPEQEALVDVLFALVRMRAHAESMNPSSLAAKSDLEQFLLDRDQCKLIKGWRKALIGEELDAFLRGETSVSIVDERLEIAQKLA